MCCCLNVLLSLKLILSVLKAFKKHQCFMLLLLLFLEIAVVLYLV